MKYTSLVLLSSAVLLAACDSSSRRPAVNAAPTISNIADQSITANQESQPIAFTVADDNLGTVLVSATSDNPAVVPNAGLAIGGSAGSRTLTITPTTDTVGDAMISIVVADGGGLMAGSSFLVTVDPQQLSLLQFTRDEFAADADDEPSPINAIEFSFDAEADDFADLLAP